MFIHLLGALSLLDRAHTQSFLLDEYKFLVSCSHRPPRRRSLLFQDSFCTVWSHLSGQRNDSEAALGIQNSREICPFRSNYTSSSRLSKLIALHISADAARSSESSKRRGEDCILIFHKTLFDFFSHHAVPSTGARTWSSLENRSYEELRDDLVHLVCPRPLHAVDMSKCLSG